ncbi:hypothetical protein MVEN_00088400 [Mycena venus]|uniref:Uncharacterized protein n=1 Tax=Mycena venus TaxID=2733690 RepID=A0A8H6Z7H2_9AGAR|nr:hypothetical protein MVEN_00088400 [Mycena venus]
MSTRAPPTHKKQWGCPAGGKNQQIRLTDLRMAKHSPLTKPWSTKTSGRICDMMHLRKRTKVSKITTSSPPHYDLVLEDIEQFLQTANAHASELRDFLGCH